MKQKRQIVGKFNKDLTKIEFYEVHANYKHYTIIRKQGTTKYYVWDNETSKLSNKIQLAQIPDDKQLYKKIIEKAKHWHYGDVFFWADSDFVTYYGLPGYDKLISIYKELLSIKNTEVIIAQTLIEVEENESFFNYMKCRWMCHKFMKKQAKTIKQLVKEYKLIW